MNKPPGEEVLIGRDFVIPELEMSSYSTTDIESLGSDSLAALMRALSIIYARQRRFDLAAQLLIQSVSALLPLDRKEHWTVDAKCQGELTG